MQVSVGILFLASLEAETPMGVVLHPFNTNVTKITFNIRGLIRYRVVEGVSSAGLGVG